MTEEYEIDDTEFLKENFLTDLLDLAKELED